LDLYLVGSAARHRVSTGDRVLEVQVEVTNPSDRPSTVVAAELHVTYSVQGVITTVKIPNSTDGNADLATPTLNLLELPARLDANDARSGWVLFRVQGTLLKGRDVDRFDLVIRDVHGIEQKRQVRVVSDAVT
jgi:hypothetical protein